MIISNQCVQVHTSHNAQTCHKLWWLAVPGRRDATLLLLLLRGWRQIARALLHSLSASGMQKFNNKNKQTLEWLNAKGATLNCALVTAKRITDRITRTYVYTATVSFDSSNIYLYICKKYIFSAHLRLESMPSCASTMFEILLCFEKFSHSHPRDTNT